jgi:hypothetical protein
LKKSGEIQPIYSNRKNNTQHNATRHAKGSSPTPNSYPARDTKDIKEGITYSECRFKENQRLTLELHSSPKTIHLNLQKFLLLSLFEVQQGVSHSTYLYPPRIIKEGAV